MNNTAQQPGPWAGGNRVALTPSLAASGATPCPAPHCPVPRGSQHPTALTPTLTFVSNLVKQVFSCQHQKNEVFKLLKISHIIPMVNKKWIASRSEDKVMSVKRQFDLDYSFIHAQRLKQFLHPCMN